jgi:hypothetical protein
MVTAHYRILLLPQRQIIAEHFSLQEAVAFLRGYEEVAAGNKQEAVIASEPAMLPNCVRQSAAMGCIATQRNRAARTNKANNRRNRHKTYD